MVRASAQPLEDSLLTLFHIAFLAKFCEKHNSAPDGSIFKNFCLKDIEKFLLKIVDRTSSIKLTARPWGVISGIGGDHHRLPCEIGLMVVPGGMP